MGHVAWNFEDISGKRYGKLLVVKPYSKSKSGNVIYECKCDCGRTAYKTKVEQSLDIIDCNGNYEPSNCRWADIKTQNMNRRNMKNGKQ